MRHPDVDKLLREERFDELTRLGALPAKGSPLPSDQRCGRAYEALCGRYAVPTAPCRPGVLTIRQADVADEGQIARLADTTSGDPRGQPLVERLEGRTVAAPSKAAAAW